jgi:hypothetical protein
MRLPFNCPHMIPTPIRLRQEELSTCCRGLARLLSLEDEPLCCTIGSESEVYRFVWHSSFDGQCGRPHRTTGWHDHASVALHVVSETGSRRRARRGNAVHR